ncbi:MULTISPECIES: type 4 pilus major pilin [Photorhabdus]|uniref:Type IV prepilin n=2 Tax=Photorhabdus TaxID=29487 RepID=A0ABX0B3T4_9GAMM|nr:MULTISPECIES: type 4 pilus major pilin [Photorhabdus]MCC8372892.1 prepilin-type N-terminal cleavage/methylation domain-containing protein [Photorhabdus bodei]MCC8462912.1 prepilin-type N-terminal cleavage/methylation domain-containing protein [Photorhabdus bodei]MCT8351225.1 prepilin-type N-terminal cleavage/methylation domain-containing protein [Photorhabdus kayaii]MDB6372386.1 type 4 pilus major pilin [Photorhabdus bodei]NDL13068.1 type IV prepilin [Photorhabdus kayaii]
MNKKVNVLRGARYQLGFTLIEALVVMIVGIVILAAAAAGIGKLFRASEISTESSNITQMAANLKSIKNGAKGYDSLDNKIAIHYKVVPANMTQDGKSGIIFNSWNGKVIISPGDTTAQTFKIEYQNVPDEACQQLSLKLRVAGWSKMTVGGGGGKGQQSATEIKPDSTLAQIEAACNANDANTVTLVSAS